MNSSYKIALICAATLCVVVIGYYMSDDQAPAEEPAISLASDDAAPQPETTSTPGTSSAPRAINPSGSAGTQRPGTSTAGPGDDRRSGSNPLLDRVKSLQSSTAQPSPGRSDSDSDLFGSVSRSPSTGPNTPTASTPSTPTPRPVPIPTTPPEPARPDNVITLGEEPQRPAPRDPLATLPSSETGLSRPLPPLPGAPEAPLPGSAPQTAPAPRPTASTSLPPVSPTPPAPRPTASSTPPSTAPRSSSQPPTYTIKEGDTFSSVAAELSRRYNARVTFFDVSEANPTLDPMRLRPGQVIKLPPPPTARAATELARPSANRPAAPGPDSRHTVGGGQTLSSIARQYYGDESKWHLIYEANRSTIGSDPDRLREGMKLVIPPAPNPAR